MAAPNIDPKRTALILCDFQNGLVMSQRPIEPWGAKTLIANAKKVLDHARKVGMAIIYVRVGYRQDLKDLAPKAFTPGENWGSPGLAVGNVEQQIVEELTPEPGDFIVTKHTISPFNNTDIEVYLRRAGAENIILMGYSTTAVIKGDIQGRSGQRLQCGRRQRRLRCRHQGRARGQHEPHIPAQRMGGHL